MRSIARRIAMAAFLAPLALALVACDLLTADPDPNVRLELESDRIVLSWEEPAVIHFMVTNRGGATARVSACGGEIASRVDRREDGAWVDARATICFGHLDGSPLRLEPGASALGSRPLYETGTYRLQVWVTDRSGSEPQHLTLSATFTVEEPSRSGGSNARR